MLSPNKVEVNKNEMVYHINSCIVGDQDVSDRVKHLSIHSGDVGSVQKLVEQIVKELDLFSIVDISSKWNKELGYIIISGTGFVCGLEGGIISQYEDIVSFRHSVASAYVGSIFVDKMTGNVSWS